MELKNWVGIILIIIGSAFQVAGFYDVIWAKIVSIIFIVIGAFIFCTQRYIAHKESSEFNYGVSRKNTSLPLMGDIFNVSGQRTGGRKDEWQSNDSSGSSDSGGGD